MIPRELRFTASRSAGEVSALLIDPPHAHTLFAFAHGAGAGPRHVFMEQVSGKLADRGIATLRYAFPYIEKRSGRPDPMPILLATVRGAVDLARSIAGARPLFAGGKSMGGRMSSNAAAVETLPDVRGIAFLGFPLHPANRPGIERAAHLHQVEVPMLFIQGTRDALAEPALLEPIVQDLGERATLHIIADADHSFHVRKRVTGRSGEDVLDEICDVLARWIDGVVQGRIASGDSPSSSIGP